jgi:3-oxoacyl-[acyl-carrier-protein] synthase III
MIPVRILGTGSVLPGRLVTTAEVAAAVPGRDAATIEAKTGIATRHWAPRGTRMADVGAEALRHALEAAGLAPADLRRLIFVSSIGGDYVVPATANAVANKLGLLDTCDCFDVNNACVGFLTAFDVAARSAATGLAPTGIVVVELNSHVIKPEDPRPYLIFGDAAAAVVVGAGRPGEGVRGVSLANHAVMEAATTLPHPRLTGSLETVHFAISSREMSDGVVDLMVRAARRALDEAGDTMADVDWVLPHQPNGPLLDAIAAALGASPERMVRVVHEIGSVAAASIPVSLDRLFRTRQVRPGARILMVGVGAGVSYGAVLYRVAR